MWKFLDVLNFNAFMLGIIISNKYGTNFLLLFKQIIQETIDPVKLYYDFVCFQWLVSPTILLCVIYSH